MLCHVQSPQMIRCGVTLRVYSAWNTPVIRSDITHHKVLQKTLKKLQLLSRFQISLLFCSGPRCSSLFSLPDLMLSQDQQCLQPKWTGMDLGQTVGSIVSASSYLNSKADQQKVLILKNQKYSSMIHRHGRGFQQCFLLIDNCIRKGFHTKREGH